MKFFYLLFTFPIFFSGLLKAQTHECNVFNDKFNFSIYSIIFPDLTNDPTGEIYVDIWSKGFYYDEKDNSHPSGTGILSVISKSGDRMFFAGTFKYGVPIGTIRVYDKSGNCIEYYFNSGKIVSQKVISEESILKEENIIVGAAIIGKLLWEGGKWILKNSESSKTNCSKGQSSSYKSNRSYHSTAESSSNAPCKISVKNDGTVSGRPYFVATISKGKNSIEYGFYFHEGGVLKDKGYWEYTVIENEDFLGKTLDEAKQKILEISCSKLNK